MYLDEIADEDEVTVNEAKDPSQVMVDNFGDSVERIRKEVTLKQTPSKDQCIQVQETQCLLRNEKSL